MNKHCVLIVDDIAINRTVLAEVFRQGGYAILEAENGADALAVMRAQAADISILLLDLLMPGMDGFAVLAQMRESAELSQIPVIINTVAGDSENELRALQLGALDFITKPYLPEIILRRADNILARIALTQQLAQKQIAELETAFSRLTEVIPGGVATFRLEDGRARALFCNCGLLNLFGYNQPDGMSIVQNCPDLLSIVHPSERERIRSELQAAVSHSTQLNESSRFMHSDGSYRWVRFTVSRYLQETRGVTFIAVFQDITDVIEMQMRFKHRLDHDTLTGIWNREAFCRKTERRLRAYPSIACTLVCMDIDNFKVINELLGTRVGDEVLCRTAETVAQTYETFGTFCRLEADHFAWCVPRERLQLQHFAAALEAVYTQMNLGYNISVRYGIYEIDDPTLSVDLMCDRANLAICNVPQDARSRFSYYDDVIRTDMLAEQDIVANMDLAIAQQQFRVFYQPLFSASTQHLSGAEALIRWERPGIGMVPPDQFLRVFEKNGLITRLDMFVWEEVCRYLAARLSAHREVVPISVNMSRLDIYHPNLFEEIQDMVQRHGISPALLKFEITENLFIENQSRINDLVARLQAAGFAILMDDFGSGYSSLNTLKDLPVDILKIDRGFITDISTSERGACILSSIIRLSQRLQIPVVAEGIETKEQFDFIRGLGCDNIQGYYFSRPLPEAEFNALLDRYLDVLSPDSADAQLGQFRRWSLEHRCLLVADSSKSHRALLRELLGGQYDVIEAENGAEALELLRQEDNHVSLVLLNLIMPVMNGYSFLHQLRQNPAFLRLPVIALTESDSAESEIMALEAGANDYLKRPYDPMLLQLRIANLLQLYHKDAPAEENSDKSNKLRN